MESLLRYLVSDDALPVTYGTSRLYSTISEVSDAISYGPNAIVELLDAMLYSSNTMSEVPDAMYM